MVRPCRFVGEAKVQYWCFFFLCLQPGGHRRKSYTLHSLTFPVISTMAQSTSKRWSRLASALLLCLSWRPGSDAASSCRRRLRQSSPPPLQQKQQQHNHLEQHQPPTEPFPFNQSTSILSRNLQEDRIVNGQDAHGARDFPFFAQWFRGCGGSLIHSDIILTAAHVSEGET